MKGLKDVHQSKRKEAWNTRYLSLVGKLDDEFDIRRKNIKKSDEIVAFFGTEMTEEEEDLYDDNCVRVETGKCPRKRWARGLDTVWQQAANKRPERMECNEKFARQRELRFQREREHLTPEKSISASDSASEVQLNDNLGGNRERPGSYVYI